MWIEIACGLIVPILLYVLVSYIEQLLELRKFPPGPFPLPIIGNLHSLGEKPHQTLAEYSKKYGSVFSISFGLRRVVIISDIAATREALVQKGNIFAGRAKSYSVELATRGYKDIVFKDYGPLWKIMRKIGHSSLKTYGEGKESFEKSLVIESEELHKRLLKKSESPIELHSEFGAAVLNVICFIVFGERYQYSDPAFKEVLSLVNQVVEGISNTYIDFLPWFRFLPFTRLKMFEDILSKYFLFLKEQLIKHKESFDENNIRDFTDSVIRLSKDATLQKKIDEELTDEHLEHIVSDMFVGGTETTLTSLLWTILYMVHYPKYQEEIYKEIISVVGENRYPCLSDKDSLNLVKASLKESLRLASLLPLGVPHKTLSETTLMGLKIPKDTTVIINHWQLHNDTNFWENPEDFNPYRWISEDNNFDSDKATSYLPFSAGTRVCLGKAVAEAELFVFFTRLIRDFKFKGTPGCPLPSLVGKCTITLAPIPFDVILTPRVNNLILSVNDPLEK